MCWSSTKTTLILTAILCMCMNGFNLTSRALGFREKLREDKSAAYIPDVNDISKWVNGRQNSDNIIMGLAGVSLVFDFVLFGGAVQENARLIQISGLWGSFDCVADAVIGFLAANYTMPSFESKTIEQPAKKSLRRRHKAKGYPYEMMQIMKYEMMQMMKSSSNRTEETKLGIREPPPSTAKQFLHFAWVILRLIIKRDEANRLHAAKPAGGGGGAGTVMSTMEG